MDEKEKIQEAVLKALEDADLDDISGGLSKGAKAGIMSAAAIAASTVIYGAVKYFGSTGGSIAANANPANAGTAAINKANNANAVAESAAKKVSEFEETIRSRKNSLNKVETNDKSDPLYAYNNKDKYSGKSDVERTMDAFLEKRRRMIAPEEFEDGDDEF